MHKIFFSFILVLCAIVYSSHSVQAATLSIEPVKISFDSTSVGIGYTLKTLGDEAWLGVPPFSFGDATEAVVVLRHVPKRRVKATLTGEVSLSPLFRYKVKDPAIVEGPLWVSIAWRKTTDKTYVLKQWNTESEIWETLESTIQEDASRVQAQVNAQTGIVGVFEAEKPEPVAEITQHTGKASWYHGNSIYGYGSAMNIFPIGTRVRVTNVDNGKQVDTIIVSTGPFVPGRIIDLSKNAFNTISNTSVGVINVIVEEIK